MSSPFAPPLPEHLPDGWEARVPDAGELGPVVDLSRAEKEAVQGSSAVAEDKVAAELVGPGSWTRREVVVADDQERVVAWARVHDRAAGRTNVELTVDRDLDAEPAERLGASVLAWADVVGEAIARGRGLGGTQLDASVREDDPWLQGCFARAGYEHTRTWLQMTRPVAADEGGDGLPGPREGVRVRRVATHEDGSPVAIDLQTVHRMLEESFADHFNSYRESFPEFLARLREDPGHRWDHWWIAEVDVDGAWTPGGAVVASTLPDDGAGVAGSYVDYIGVHRLARGRGVAKALLHSVIRDAAERGRNRVGLEVDDDSPTGADGLYRSMGWITEHRTQSWHRAVDVPEIDTPAPQPSDVPG